MQYFLHKEGKPTGPFSLEELRRRRDSGEIAGTDFVWRESMDQWQVLNAVLPEASGNPSPKTILWIVTAAVAVAVISTGFLAWFGYKAFKTMKLVQQSASGSGEASVQGSSDAMAAASKPIVVGPGSLTETKVLERSRAFRIRQYL